jgi:hypothetical protein
MNIYRIEISSEKTDAISNRKTLGYAAGTNEYDALKNIGFIRPILQTYTNGVWFYKAENAASCSLYIEKLEGAA